MKSNEGCLIWLLFCVHAARFDFVWRLTSNLPTPVRLCTKNHAHFCVSWYETAILEHESSQNKAAAQCLR